MLEFNILTEFSSTYCIGICAFLIPANLFATSSTIILVLLKRPTIQVWQTAFIASFFALLMILHVCAWFMMGVVMAPTYILLGLASICLFANLRAVLSNKYQHSGG
ncbi:MULTISPECIES: hypothetical protein [Calothrix]|uniref:Uncharacterized protein n=2 Tax=Calothrix TaxID=1186 RepID=A0ABR8A7B5_9CYAN|nr:MULTISPECIES: hypothetical protein [Calothrix]MBD2195891.1 hypothetical protein [Calothrix parietina FACHB-288]MBD2227605.1 hypothetical protein [Calothrix anomala FACHB-343]